MRRVLFSIALALITLSVSSRRSEAQACSDCALFGPGFICYETAVIGYQQCYAYNGSGNQYCQLNNPCGMAFDMAVPEERNALLAASSVLNVVKAVSAQPAMTIRNCQLAKIFLQHLRRQEGEDDGFVLTLAS